MKDNAGYGVVERRPVPESGATQRHEIVFLYKWGTVNAICSCAASRSGTKPKAAGWCSSPIIAARDRR